MDLVREWLTYRTFYYRLSCGRYITGKILKTAWDIIAYFSSYRPFSGWRHFSPLRPRCHWRAAPGVSPRGRAKPRLPNIFEIEVLASCPPVFVLGEAVNEAGQGWAEGG